MESLYTEDKTTFILVVEGTHGEGGRLPIQGGGTHQT